MARGLDWGWRGASRPAAEHVHHRIFPSSPTQESLAYPASVGAAVVGDFTTKSMDCINRLETLALRDPGKRGIAHLARPSELWHAACDLAKAKRVLITTGSRAVVWWAEESHGRMPVDLAH